MRNLLLVLILLVTASAPAAGQSRSALRFGFSPHPIELTNRERAKNLSPAFQSGDHRVMGGVIGGFVGVIIVAAGHGFADNDSSDRTTTILDFAKIFATIGIGALIGASFPKGP